MQLEPHFVEILPDLDEIEAGQLWISHKHRTINLRCPCECGGLTVLSLHPSRWHVHYDGQAVTLCGPAGLCLPEGGSVWANSGCGSHYFIRRNTVAWADNIEPDRHAEYAQIEQERLLGHDQAFRPMRLALNRALRMLVPSRRRNKPSH